VNVSVEKLGQIGCQGNLRRLLPAACNTLQRPRDVPHDKLKVFKNQTLSVAHAKLV
jgi:hypothetical protein